MLGQHRREVRAEESRVVEILDVRPVHTEDVADPRRRQVVDDVVDHPAARCPRACRPNRALGAGGLHRNWPGCPLTRPQPRPVPSAVVADARKKIVMVPALHVGAGNATLALALKVIRRRARLGWVAFGGNPPRPRDGGQRRASATAEEPAVAAACVIYVTDDGEPEMVRKLGDGGEELRKVATADYYARRARSAVPLPAQRPCGPAPMRP